jgi:hypothetical protein
MKVKIYRYLCAMNEGFDQVRRSLQALAKHAPFDPGEMRRFEQLTAETRAATNSYVLEKLEAKESDEAGRLYGRRKARQRREEELD